jgi:hypothetical protein
VHGFAWSGTVQLEIGQYKATVIGASVQRPQSHQSQRLAKNTFVSRVAAV